MIAFCAASVPRLGLQHEVDDVELAVGVGGLGGRQQLHVGEVDG